MVNWEVFKGKVALDPFCGNGETVTVLKEVIDMATNDINSHFMCDYERDALNPESYHDWEKFRVCVTSPPFSMNDIAIPLCYHFFSICFIHVPSWYVCDAHNGRHLWLADLAKMGHVKVLNTNFVRNRTLGRFCIWLVLSKDKALLEKALKPSPSVLKILMAPPLQAGSPIVD
jgi:hypothetical protein